MSVLDNIYATFFDTVLRGESKTYNDHNWYTSGGLRGYIEGRGGNTYPLLKKPLSEYTIGEVKAFQSRPRDNTGQLWATGRYQIIPNTLIGAMKKAGLNDSDKYSQSNQDKLARELLKDRKDLWNYLSSAVPDTTENLQKAGLQMAMIWSSIGVPYRVQGSKRVVNKDESYYSGGGDKASVSSNAVAEKLRYLRNGLAGKVFQAVGTGVGFVKEKPLITIGMATAFTLACYVIYKQLIRK